MIEPRQVRELAERLAKEISWPPSAYYEGDQMNDSPGGVTELNDLDSFSFVELVTALEDSLGLRLLDEINSFEGNTFQDLAEFIMTCYGSRVRETAPQPPK